MMPRPAPKTPKVSCDAATFTLITRLARQEERSKIAIVRRALAVYVREARDVS